VLSSNLRTRLTEYPCCVREQPFSFCQHKNQGSSAFRYDL